MGPEYLQFLFGGLVYLLSPTFREKKKRKWSSQSAMYKIFEIGLWVSIPVVTLFVIVAAIAKR